MPVFSINDLSVTFRRQGHDVEAVRGVSFAVEEGRTLAIVGESGSGKSVSLLAATGLLNAPGAVVQGSALHHGRELIGLSAQELRRIRGKEIGFVFQDPLSNLHPLKTVGQQVAEAISTHQKVPRRLLRERVVQLLDEVGIKEPRQRMDDHPAHFSGGMRQRVMIAIAIALNPKILIADEATTALDVTVQASILQLLKRLQDDHGTAIIFVSHDLAVVSDIADDIAVMRLGEVVESGPADQIYEHPQHPYTQELLGATRHGAVLDDGPERVVSDDTLLQVTEVRQEFAVRGRRKATFTAVDGVSFDIRKQEILGLVGESGSGKSTIGRIIAGLQRPTGGTVALDDEVYARPGSGRSRLDPVTRARIQVVFQDPYGSLNPRRQVGAILAEPFEIHRDLSGSQVRDEVAGLVRQVELPPEVVNRYPAHLSGGQRQRVAIARALALRPDLVIADEAVSALDITTQSQILALLRRLRGELGVSFLFISHDLAVVAELCDRVIVLENGQIVERGSTREVFTSPSADYTRLLLDSIPGKRRGLAAGTLRSPEEPLHV